MSNNGGDQTACCDVDTTFELTGISLSVFVILYLVILCARYLVDLRRRPSGGGSRDRPKPPGLDPSAIAALPSFAYRTASARENDDAGVDEQKGRSSSVECSVCLGILEEGEMVRVLPSCDHMFHAACVDVWLGNHSTCPVCRGDAEPGKMAEEGIRPGTGEACPRPPQSPRPGPPSPELHSGAAVFLMDV